MQIAIFPGLTSLDAVGPYGLFTLGIEYDPQPPFDAGAPSKKSPEIRELVRVMLDDQRDRLLQGTP